MVDKLTAFSDDEFGLDLSVAGHFAAGGQANIQGLIGQLPSGLQSQFASIMTPDVQSALQSGANIAADITPTLAIIDDLQSGRGVSPQSGIMAMAGVASLINPVAGAVVLAMGTTMSALADATNSVFRSLGLQHTEPQPKIVLGGIGYQVDQMPFPPRAQDGTVIFDPAWRHWEWLIQENTQGGFALQNLPNYMVPWIRFAYGGAIFPPDTDPMGHLTSALAGKAHWYKYDGSSVGVPDLSMPRNAFERFFNELLKRDIEYWWNGQGYISPRDLLTKAVDAWNASHDSAGGADVTYSYGQDSIPAYILSPTVDVSGSHQAYAPVGPVHMGAQKGAAASASTGSAALTPMQRLAALRAGVQSSAEAAGQVMASRVASVSLPAAPKRVLDLRAASKVVAAQTAHPTAPAAPKPRAATETVAAPSFLSTVLPYVPVAAGVMLMPLGGLLAPVVGVAATGLWLWKKKGA